MTPVPATYEFVKIDEVYKEKNENGCPYHTLHCELTKQEVAHYRRLREREKTDG